LLIVFLLLAAGILGLYIASKNKYDDFIAPLDRKQYPLKKLYPVALFLFDAFKYKFNTGYDRSILMKVAEISGHKYSHYYLRIHWANKVIFFLLALMLMVFIGWATEPDVEFGIFALMVLGGVVYFTDDELNKKIRRRRLEIQMDFPDFMNRLTLLVNTGMTTGKALERIVMQNKKHSPLYEELSTVFADIKSGKTEIHAYEDFAKRCRIPEVTKFVSIIVQNMKKGNTELVSILRLQGNECWEMRKNAAKRLGEEASTKMLLPMMIMFIAILIIVATPAILAMQGI